MSPMQVNHTLTQLRIELETARAEVARLRRELNLLKAVHDSADAEVRQLLDENGSLIAVCREFIDRWPTEEGIDNTIQRTRAILLDHDLRNPEKQSVNRALEGK